MSMPIEHMLPDPHTFTLIVNERQRKLLWRAMRAMQKSGEDMPSCEMEMVDSLEDMLNMSGSTGSLAISPAVNSFVL